MQGLYSRTSEILRYRIYSRIRYRDRGIDIHRIGKLEVVVVRLYQSNGASDPYALCIACDDYIELIVLCDRNDKII